LRRDFGRRWLTVRLPRGQVLVTLETAIGIELRLLE
jgi:hypothetical protein